MYQTRVRKIKTNILIWLFFFVFYVTLGSNMVVLYEKSHILGSDNYRVFHDLTEIIGNHGKIRVHPLFLILCQPLVGTLDGIIRNQGMAVLLLESMLASANVLIFKNILTKIIKDPQVISIFTVIYGFSFSNMIFGTVPETFVFAAFFLLLYWDYIISLSKEEKPLEIQDYFILIFFGICCLGIVFTNYVSYIIGVIYLMLTKFPRKNMLKPFFLINLINGFSVTFLAVIQHYVWRAPIFLTSFVRTLWDRSQTEELMYIDCTLSLSKIGTAIKQLIVYPIMSGDVEIPDYEVIFSGMSNKFVVGITTFFFIVSVAFVLWKLVADIRGKKIDILLLFVSVAYIFNIVFHLFFDYSEAFLFSQHFLFLFLMIVSSAFDQFLDKKDLLTVIPVTFFACIQVVNNLFQYYHVAVLNRAFCSETYSFRVTMAKGFFMATAVGLISYALWNHGSFRESKTTLVNAVKGYGLVIWLYCVAAFLCNI